MAVNVKAKAVRLIPESTWGSEVVRISAFEPLDVTPRVVTFEDGPTWSQVRDALDPADLAEPDSGLEHAPGIVTHSA